MINTNELLNMSKEELVELLSDSVDIINYERISSKILGNYSNTQLYNGLNYDFSLNENLKPKKLKYKEKIGYNLKGEIKGMLTKRGKTFLLVANAGGGKTYVMLEASAELVEKNKLNNVVYILAVPNTSQSNQNEIGEDYIKFGFESIVGKKSKLKVEGKDKSITEILKEGHRKFSCVYDKTQEIIEEAKKIGLECVLIVDEAHKLIYDTYRVTALEGMEDSSMKADMVIMMTATPDVCKNFYKYDEIYELIDEEVKNNIEELKIVYSNNWKLTLRKELRRIKEKGKVALIKINNIPTITATKKALEKQGYLVEVMTSKNKDNYTFKTVEKFGLIGADVDVVLCTSVIECGISLKDRDIVPIEIIGSMKDFNTDNTIQFFARPRKKVSEGIIIAKNYNDEIAKDIDDFKKRKAEAEVKEEGKKIKIIRPKTRKVRTIASYLSEVQREVKKYYITLNNTLEDKLKTEYKEFVKEYMIDEIKRVDRTNSIELDTENLKLYVNTKELIKTAFGRRDRFIISSSPLTLESHFKNGIFYDKIILDADLGGNYNEEDLENIKEEKKDRKEAQGIKKTKEDEYRSWLEDKNFLKVLPALADGSLNRANIKNYNIDISFRDLIEFRDSSLFELMRTCFRSFNIGETAKIITSRYKETGEYISKTDIKQICERKHIVEQIKTGYYKDLGTKYDVICDIIQTFKTKDGTRKQEQIYLTNDLIVIINAELNRNKCTGYSNKKTLDILYELIGPFGYDFNWKTFYTEKSIKKLEKAISSKSGSIRPALKNKIINEVEKIYKLGIQNKSGSEYLIINNPHKTFNLDSVLKDIVESK